uniref:ATP synthase F0 subunit 8 n=1 Tax=Zearchaea sp. New Zealand TaxID=1090244 RepID=H2E3M9_9ARAC|nr:ATP synthase F0 subunit 8 [Zearchaea sp. New Zealand]
MPQLCPLYWTLSFFMFFIIYLIMIDIYFFSISYFNKIIFIKIKTNILWCW